eukprot:11915-Heterococcus_DN1.PRE.2
MTHASSTYCASCKLQYNAYNNQAASQQRVITQQLPERVVVLCHQPLHPGTAGAVCLLWNYAVVLQLLWERPRGEVIACFAGHAHRGGYVQDTHGIHHQVLEAALERSSSFQSVDVCSASEQRWHATLMHAS